MADLSPGCSGLSVARAVRISASSVFYEWRSVIHAVASFVRAAFGGGGSTHAPHFLLDSTHCPRVAQLALARPKASQTIFIPQEKYFFG